MDTLEVLNESGHLRVTWDPENPEETEAARKTIEDLKTQGYSFFEVEGEKDGVLEVRRVEEPKSKKKKATRTVATRPMAGG